MKILGCFISDLHLLSTRSVGARLWQDFRGELLRCNLLVLGGDIFDFRWSRHEELSHSLSEVSNWLEDLLEHYPHLRVAYVLGNHDCLLASQSEFHHFSNTFAQFTWEEHQFGIGDQLFLHGDILDAGDNMTQLSLYRQRFVDDRRSRGRLANRLYDAVIATRLHRIPSQILHPPWLVARKLSRFLEGNESPLVNSAKRIYIGHTHLPFQAESFQQQTFFNAGSGIRHLEFAPCFFECSGDIDEAIELSRRAHSEMVWDNQTQ